MKKYLLCLLLAGNVLAGSFTILSGAGVDESSTIDEEFPNYNYGNKWNLPLGDYYTPGSSDYRVVLRFVNLPDSLAVYSGNTFDSALITVAFEVINLNAADSLALACYKLNTAAWTEGTNSGGFGADSGGVTWDSAHDATGGGIGVDWIDGGDYNATREDASRSDTSWVHGGMANNDSITLFVSGATITAMGSSNTGVLIKHYYAADGNADNIVTTYMYSDRQPAATARPHIEVFYTATEASTTGVKLRKVHLRKVKM